MSDKNVQLVFLGAGDGIGEIMNVVEACNEAGAGFDIVGALDDNAALHGTMNYGIPVLGGLDKVTDFPDAKFIFAIGSQNTHLQRLDIVEKLGLARERYQTLIHPGANVFKTAEIGPGSIIQFGATLSQGVKVGAFSLITINVTIGSFVTIGSGAILASQVFVGGHCKLGSGCFVGACSAIADGVELGAGAKVGMASAVYKRVPDGIFVLGNPARKLAPLKVPASLAQLWQSEKNQ